MTEITTKEGEIFLVSPYDQAIARKCRNLNGDWTGSVWKFEYDEDVLAAVKHAVEETFGFDYDAPRATARVEFKEDFYQSKAPYTMGGYILSEARSRDSGANVGPGVLLLEGKIGSGGSMKHWSSEVRAGSVFKINNFPKGAKVEDAENIIITYDDEESTGADQSTVLTELLDQYSVEEIESYLEKRKNKEETEPDADLEILIENHGSAGLFQSRSD